MSRGGAMALAVLAGLVACALTLVGVLFFLGTFEPPRLVAIACMCIPMLVAGMAASAVGSRFARPPPPLDAWAEEVTDAGDEDAAESLDHEAGAEPLGDEPAAQPLGDEVAVEAPGDAVVTPPDEAHLAVPDAAELDGIREALREVDPPSSIGLGLRALGILGLVVFTAEVDSFADVMALVLAYLVQDAVPVLAMRAFGFVDPWVFRSPGWAQAVRRKARLADPWRRGMVRLLAVVPSLLVATMLLRQGGDWLRVYAIGLLAPAAFSLVPSSHSVGGQLVRWVAHPRSRGGQITTMLTAAVLFGLLSRQSGNWLLEALAITSFGWSFAQWTLTPLARTVMPFARAQPVVPLEAARVSDTLLSRLVRNARATSDASKEDTAKRVHWLYQQAIAPSPSPAARGALTVLYLVAILLVGIAIEASGA